VLQSMSLFKEVPHINYSAGRDVLTGSFSASCSGWQHGVVVSGVGLINEVNQHRARLILGWGGGVNHLGM